MKPDEPLAAAVETFVRGFAACRSRTHPYLVERVEGIWRLSDAPRTGKSGRRRDEWVALDRDPQDVDAVARRDSPSRYLLCAIVAAGEDDGPLRLLYKRLGYRLLTTEPLFVHSLTRIPRVASKARIVRVDGAARAAEFGKATRTRPAGPESWGDAGVWRQYMAVMDGRRGADEIVGWVRSVPVGKNCWVADLHVNAERRRQGIGSALMTVMLRDDRRLGATGSVLTSSRVGALLYPQLGYRQIGLLLAYQLRRGG